MFFRVWGQFPRGLVILSLIHHIYNTQCNYLIAHNQERPTDWKSYSDCYLVFFLYQWHYNHCMYFFPSFVCLFHTPDSSTLFSWNLVCFYVCGWVFVCYFVLWVWEFCFPFPWYQGITCQSCLVSNCNILVLLQGTEQCFSRILIYRYTEESVALCSFCFASLQLSGLLSCSS